MKFELEPHNRNVPDNELIADVQRVAAELRKKSTSGKAISICISKIGFQRRRRDLFVEPNPNQIKVLANGHV